MRDSDNLLIQCRGLLEDDKLEGLFRVYGFSEPSRNLEGFTTYHDAPAHEAPLFSVSDILDN